MGKSRTVEIQLGEHFVVSFEDLYGVPALLLFRQIMDGRFLDMCQGMFN